MAETTVRSRLGVSTLVLVLAASACNARRTDDPGLSTTSSAVLLDVPVPPADGPKLGSVANVTFVVDRPSRGGRVLGYLHAGAMVARANEPRGNDGCPGGWYPIRPRGFVCVGESATLDLTHPTLVAMAIRPKLDATLPYAYARTRRDTPLYEVNRERDAAVHEVGTLSSRSGAAIVGTWNANDENKTQRQLALLSDGRFVQTADLEAASSSAFRGVTFAASDESKALPIAFVTRRGAKQWSLAGDRAEPDRGLLFHSEVSLGNGVRNLGSEDFWEIDDERWVKRSDVAVARPRTRFPDFVTASSRWIDVSVLTGTAVLYEGRRPVYATLVSVGSDRLGDPAHSAATARGEFPIVYKHVTAAGADPKAFARRVEIFDAPWALELGSGQWLYGAFWHDRFGTAHGLGNLELAPADAAFIWRWVKPDLPEGWHGVSAAMDSERTMVSIHE
jgi:hypothetical protein